MKIKDTKSICPDCRKIIDAILIEIDNKIFIRKRCETHGEFEDLYWSDYEMYRKYETWKYDKGSRNEGCPYKCGICDFHQSRTVLSIIDVTNRCNLSCPDCFAGSGKEYRYEPSIKEIKKIIHRLRELNSPALQLSGGEPTLRDDLPEIVRYAKEKGFVHVQVNTNGIKLANLEYCLALTDAGTGAIYLQFDGCSPQPYVKLRGRNLLREKEKAVENCREAGLGIVLVPTIAKGVNEMEIGDIIKYAIENSDVIRGVNFQPISFCGRSSRRELRITIPDVIKEIEAQCGGLLKRDDFYPVPAAVPLIRVVEALTSRQYAEFSSHFTCGSATYLFLGEEARPITSYVDVDRFLKELLKVKGKLAKLRLLYSLRLVKGDMRRLIYKILRTGKYDFLREIHQKLLLIGIMHFMDPFNFDLERVEKCVIHYALPDGRVIPFCSYNSLHREEFERMYACG